MRPDGSQGRGLARHGRLRRRGAVSAVVSGVAIALAVVLASTAGVAAWAIYDVLHSFKPTITLVGPGGTTAPPVPDINAIEGGFNMLLVGSDTREGQGGRYGDESQIQGQRNDVTILVHVSEDHSNAVVISIPRDTFVPIPACTDEKGVVHSARSSAKINESLEIGGLSCTWSTVSQLTGLTIHFAAAVTFEGVTAMADAVGGVEVCLADPIIDPKTDLNLPAGNVTLSGREAAQFLRTRHGVGDGSDIGRISNQQVYMSALMRKLKSSETLSSPVTLYSIAKVAAKNVSLSDGLDNLNTMVSIALALKDVPAGNFTLVQYPVADVTDGVVPIAEAARTLMDAVKADKGLTLTGGSGYYGSKPQSPDKSTPTETPSTSTPRATEAPKVELPRSVTGQTVDDVRCSNGNG